MNSQVIIVPGFMGTSLVDLANNRKLWDSFTLFWSDLTLLRLSEDGLTDAAPGVRVEPLADVWPVYRGLMRRLRRCGYRVRFFPYDWRKSIESAAENLDAFVKKHFPEGKVNLITHSMGGLVAALWLAAGGAERLGRLTSIAFPAGGVETAVSALLVGYSRIAAVNLRANKKLVHQLAWQVPSLYQMLPPLPGIFERSQWPEHVGIQNVLLEKAAEVREILDEALSVLRTLQGKIALVAGIGDRMDCWSKETGIPLTRDLKTKGRGDGWVRQESVRIEGVETFGFRRRMMDAFGLGPLFFLPYVAGTHPFLPMFGRVQNAVLEFLESGEIHSLPVFRNP